MDGGWPSLPTRPRRHCDPASLVFFLTFQFRAKSFLYFNSCVFPFSRVWFYFVGFIVSWPSGKQCVSCHNLLLSQMIVLRSANGFLSHSWFYVSLWCSDAISTPFSKSAPTRITNFWTTVVLQRLGRENYGDYPSTLCKGHSGALFFCHMWESFTKSSHSPFVCSYANSISWIQGNSKQILLSLKPSAMKRGSVLKTSFFHLTTIKKQDLTNKSTGKTLNPLMTLSLLMEATISTMPIRNLSNSHCLFLMRNLWKSKYAMARTV